MQIGTFKVDGVAVPCREMVRPNIIYRVEVSGTRVVMAHTPTADEVGEVQSQCLLEHFILIGGKRSTSRPGPQGSRSP